MKKLLGIAICLLTCLSFTSCANTNEVNGNEVQTSGSETVESSVSQTGKHNEVRALNQIPDNSAKSTTDLQQLSPDFQNGQRAFSSEISAAYLFSDFEKNKLISPISVRYAFAALSEGAGPQLRNEFTKLLHKGKDEVFQKDNALHKAYLNSIFDPKEKNLGLIIKDSIWVDYDLKNIKPEFLETLAKFHHSEVYHGDLSSEATANAMNDWVKKATRDLIDPKKKPDGDSKLVIMNTVYFKDAWDNAFQKSDNFKDVFTTFSGKTVDAEFMKNTVIGSSYAETPDYVIASLDFSNRFRYKVLLPKEGKRLQDLVGDNPIGLVQSFLSAQTDKPADINWKVPISEMDSNINLKELLTSMGYGSIFSDNADYTSISDTSLMIGSATQLTKLKLNNEGVEAAAFTEIKMEATSAPMQVNETIDMNLDKPYLFSIEFWDGTPLFVGVMNTP